MSAHDSQARPTLTRRHFLHHLGWGTAGGLAWSQGGWPVRTARAQQRTSRGQMTWAIHATLVPSWFDPAETPGIITPFLCLYALHDALIKPMPEGPMTPGMMRRRRSVIPRNAPGCSSRSSASCMTKPGFCRFGRLGSSARQAPGWPCQGSG